MSIKSFELLILTVISCANLFPTVGDEEELFGVFEIKNDGFFDSSAGIKRTDCKTVLKSGKAVNPSNFSYLYLNSYALLSLIVNTDIQVEFIPILSSTYTDSVCHDE